MKRHIFVIFHVRYLEKKSAPPTGKEAEEEESQVISSGVDNSKKPEGESEASGVKKEGGNKNKFQFDRTKTFFRNLINMMRWIKQVDSLLEVTNNMNDNKNQMDVSEEDLRDRFLENIFKVRHETLRSIQPIVVRK